MPKRPITEVLAAAEQGRQAGTEQENGLAKDLGLSVMRGYAGIGAGLAHVAGAGNGPGYQDDPASLGAIADSVSKSANYWTGKMSSKFRARTNRELADGAWKDPVKIAAVLAEALPSITAGFGAGAGATKLLAGAAKATGVEVTGGGVAASLNLFTGARAAAVSDKALGVAGAAIGEGTIATPMVMKQTHDQVMSVPEHLLVRSEAYQTAYHSLPEEMDDGERRAVARRAVAQAVERDAGFASFVATSIFGAPSGAFVAQRLLKGEAGATLGGTMFKQAFLEGVVEEVPQSTISESLIPNLAIRGVPALGVEGADPTQSPFEGTFESMLAAAVAGPAMGAAMGPLTHYSQPGAGGEGAPPAPGQPPPDDEAPGAIPDQPTAAGEPAIDETEIDEVDRVIAAAQETAAAENGAKPEKFADPEGDIPGRDIAATYEQLNEERGEVDPEEVANLRAQDFQYHEIDIVDVLRDNPDLDDEVMVLAESGQADPRDPDEPVIIANRNGKAGVLVDGRHRIAAALARGESTISAYVSQQSLEAVGVPAEEAVDGDPQVGSEAPAEPGAIKSDEPAAPAKRKTVEPKKGKEWDFRQHFPRLTKERIAELENSGELDDADIAAIGTESVHENLIESVEQIRETARTAQAFIDQPDTIIDRKTGEQAHGKALEKMLDQYRQDAALAPSEEEAALERYEDIYGPEAAAALKGELEALLGERADKRAKEDAEDSEYRGKKYLWNRPAEDGKKKKPKPVEVEARGVYRGLGAKPGHIRVSWNGMSWTADLKDLVPLDDDGKPTETTAGPGEGAAAPAEKPTETTAGPGEGGEKPETGAKEGKADREAKLLAETEKKWLGKRASFNVAGLKGHVGPVEGAGTVERVHLDAKGKPRFAIDVDDGQKVFGLGEEHLTEEAGAGETTVVQPNPDAKLPKELAGAKPRYGFGRKNFTLQFESDIDRASYIVSQSKKKSKRDAEYLKFVMDAMGATEQQVIDHGTAIRKTTLKALAEDAADDAYDLVVPKQEFGGIKVEEEAKVEKPTKPEKVETVEQRASRIVREVVRTVTTEPEGRAKLAEMATLSETDVDLALDGVKNLFIEHLEKVNKTAKSLEDASILEALKQVAVFGPEGEVIGVDKKIDQSRFWQSILARAKRAQIKEEQEHNAALLKDASAEFVAGYMAENGLDLNTEIGRGFLAGFTAAIEGRGLSTIPQGVGIADGYAVAVKFFKDNPQFAPPAMRGEKIEGQGDQLKRIMDYARGPRSDLEKTISSLINMTAAKKFTEGEIPSNATPGTRRVLRELFGEGVTRFKEAVILHFRIPEPPMPGMTQDRIIKSYFISERAADRDKLEGLLTFAGEYVEFADQFARAAASAHNVTELHKNLLDRLYVVPPELREDSIAAPSLQDLMGEDSSNLQTPDLNGLLASGRGRRGDILKTPVYEIAASKQMVKIELLGRFYAPDVHRARRGENHSEDGDNASFHPPLAKIKREGDGMRDVRQGGDVQGSDYEQQFAFTSSSYGETWSGRRVQEHSNHTFDAMLDMADLLGWQDSMLSFNGNVAAAFAKLGMGFLTANAAAFYSPTWDSEEHGKTPVFNLVNKHGDGTIAHELIGHGLEFHLRGYRPGASGDRPMVPYIRRLVNRAFYLRAKVDEDAIKSIISSYLSTHERDGELYFHDSSAERMVDENGQEYWGNTRYWDKVNKDTIAARAKLAADRVRYYKRAVQQNPELVYSYSLPGSGVTNWGFTSMLMDGGRGRYWSKPEEIFARSMEAYFVEKFKARGWYNNYAVNPDHVDGMGAYPSDDQQRTDAAIGEREFVIKALDKMFSRLEITESGATITDDADILEADMPVADAAVEYLVGLDTIIDSAIPQAVSELSENVDKVLTEAKKKQDEEAKAKETELRAKWGVDGAVPPQPGTANDPNQNDAGAAQITDEDIDALIDQLEDGERRAQNGVDYGSETERGEPRGESEGEGVRPEPLGGDPGAAGAPEDRTDGQDGVQPVPDGRRGKRARGDDAGVGSVPGGDARGTRSGRAGGRGGLGGATGAGTGSATSPADGGQPGRTEEGGRDPFDDVADLIGGSANEILGSGGPILASTVQTFDEEVYQKIVPALIRAYEKWSADSGLTYGHEFIRYAAKALRARGVEPGAYLKRFNKEVGEGKIPLPGSEPKVKKGADNPSVNYDLYQPPAGVVALGAQIATTPLVESKAMSAVQSPTLTETDLEVGPLMKEAIEKGRLSAHQVAFILQTSKAHESSRQIESGDVSSIGLLFKLMHNPGVALQFADGSFIAYQADKGMDVRRFKFRGFLEFHNGIDKTSASGVIEVEKNKSFTNFYELAGAIEEMVKIHGTPIGHEGTWRQGGMSGDGTGVGKGREVAGLVLHNRDKGRKVAIWVSQNSDLIKDARGDWDQDKASNREGLRQRSPILSMDEAWDQYFSKGKPVTDGILFMAYDWLSRTANVEKLQKIIEMLGGNSFDGVVAFDEAHRMNGHNIRVGQGRNGKIAITGEPTRMAWAGAWLQMMMPNSRVAYMTATMGTKLENTGFLDKLGLWGNSSFDGMVDFVTSLQTGGKAALEAFAMHMKAAGVYMSRTLSFDGIENTLLQYTLTKEDRKQYDEWSKIWRAASSLVVSSVNQTGVGPLKKGAMMQARRMYFGASQRFFEQVLAAMQTPALIADARRETAAGEAAVVQLTRLNNPAAERKLKEGRAEEEADETDDADEQEFAVSVKDLAADYIKKHIHTRRAVKNPSTGEIEFSGEEIPRLVEQKQIILDRIAALNDYENPIDQILKAFGHDSVAEVTGRTIRPAKSGKGVERRKKADRVKEADEFQSGKRKVLIFSEAGGTGRSYHATKADPRRRNHYVLQPGWSAEKCMQGMGRTHRQGQVVAPKYKMLLTDIGAHKRFVSTVARRLEQLGAMTRGQRQTGGNGFFADDVMLEVPELSTAALSTLDSRVASGEVEYEDPENPGQMRRLSMREYSDTLMEQSGAAGLGSVTNLMNRLLMAPPSIGNAIFDAYYKILSEAIIRAREDGSLDVGMEQIQSDHTEKESDVVLNHDSRGVTTRWVKLKIGRLVKPFAWPDLHAYLANSGKLETARFGVNKTTGRIHVWYPDDNDDYSGHALEPVPSMKDMMGHGTSRYHIVRMMKHDFERKHTVLPDNQEGFAQAREKWDAKIKEIEEAGSMVTREVNLVVGAVISYWKRFPANSMPRFVRATVRDPVDPEKIEILVGRMVSDDEIEAVKAAFTAELRAGEHTPERLIELMRGGAKVNLVDGSIIRDLAWNADDESVHNIAIRGPGREDSVEGRYAQFGTVGGSTISAANLRGQDIILDERAVEVLAALTKKVPVASIDMTDEQKAAATAAATAKEAADRANLDAKAEKVMVARGLLGVPVTAAQLEGYAKSVWPNESEFIAISGETFRHRDDIKASGQVVWQPQLGGSGSWVMPRSAFESWLDSMDRLGAGRFSLATGRINRGTRRFARPLRADVVRAIASSITKGWKAKLEVLPSIFALPEEVRERIGFNINQHSTARGAIDPTDGTIYLFSDYLWSRAEVLTTLSHELTHHGIPDVVGRDKFTPFLDRVWRSFKDSQEMARIVADYGLNPEQLGDRRTAAEEFIAAAGERRVKHSLWKRFVAMFKDFLRSVGLDLDYANHEIEQLANKAVESAIRTRRQGARTSRNDQNRAADLLYSLRPSMVYYGMNAEGKVAAVASANPNGTWEVFTAPPGGQVISGQFTRQTVPDAAAAATVLKGAGLRMVAKRRFAPHVPTQQQVFTNFSIPAEDSEKWFGLINKGAVIRVLQDKMRRLKVVQEAVVANGGELTEQDDAYLAEELMNDRAADRIERFYKQLVQPLMDKIAELDIEIGDLEQYLYAKHAGERNERIASINPYFREPGRFGSGMSEERAAEIITAAAKAGLTAKMERLAKMVYAINEERLNLIEREGLESSISNTLSSVIGLSPAAGKHSGMSAIQLAAALRANDKIKLQNGATLAYMKGLGVLIEPAGGPNEAAAGQYIERGAVKGDKIDPALKGYAVIKLGAVDMWREAYKNYVPLRGLSPERQAELDELEDPERLGGKSKGLSTPGRESKRALGRESEAHDIFTYTILQMEQAIVRAEKNNVGKTFMRFVERHPNPRIWGVDVVEFEPHFDKELGEVVYGPVVGKRDPNKMVVKVNGREHHITIHDALLRRAMLETGVTKVEGAMKAWFRSIGHATRILAALNTAWNPEFWISNLPRDYQTALLNLQNKSQLPAYASQDAMNGVARKVARDTWPALGALLRHLHNPNAKSKWIQWYNEYKANGGKIEFFSLENLDDKRKALYTQLKARQKNGMLDPGVLVRAVGGYLSDFNAAFENAARLALYVNLREAGISPAVAASAAKNVTVNFHRKGEAGAFLSSLYMFFNAGVQGSTRLLTNAAKSRRLQGILFGLTMFAFAFAEMMRAGDDDEDNDGRDDYGEIEPWVKDHYFIWKGSGGKYYTPFALPYGFNVFWSIGVNMSDALHRVKDGGAGIGEAGVEFGTNITRTAINAFNPLGGENSFSQFISPSLVDPLMQVDGNKNFFGAPIMPDQQPYGVAKPDSQLYFSSVRPVSKEIAEELNSFFGGNHVRPGWVDVSPETIDHLWDSYLGGLGALVGRATTVAKKGFTGEEIPVNEIPFLRKFEREVPPYQTDRQYREIRDEIESLEEERKALAETSPGKLADFDAKYTRVLVVKPELDRTEKELRKLRKQIRELEAVGGDNKAPLVALRQQQLDFENALMREYHDSLAGR